MVSASALEWVSVSVLGWVWASAGESAMAWAWGWLSVSAWEFPSVAVFRLGLGLGSRFRFLRPAWFAAEEAFRRPAGVFQPLCSPAAEWPVASCRHFPHPHHLPSRQYPSRRAWGSGSTRAS